MKLSRQRVKNHIMEGKNMLRLNHATRVDVYYILVFSRMRNKMMVQTSLSALYWTRVVKSSLKFVPTFSPNSVSPGLLRLILTRVFPLWPQDSELGSYLLVTLCMF
jgi:hypothetical protein